MKIIITENKLHKLQTDVLNNLLGYNVSQFDNFILIYYPNDYNGDYDYAEVLMEYDYEDSRLYVDHSFLKDYAKVYFPNEEDAQLVIKDWFEKYFGVEIKYVQT
jgi:hypothetical protein